MGCECFKGKSTEKQTEKSLPSDPNKRSGQSNTHDPVPLQVPEPAVSNPPAKKLTKPNPSPSAPDILSLDPPKPRPAPGSYDTSKPITVKVEDLRLQAHSFPTTPSMKVQDLYAQIQEKTGCSTSDFVLFYTGRLLPVEEDKTIGEYGVTADSTLDLINKPKA